MSDYKGLLWGSVKGSPQPLVSEHRVGEYRVYKYFRGKIDDSLKQYLDFYGQKFIAVCTDGHPTYFVNVQFAEEVCGELTSTDSHILTKRLPYEYVKSELPPLRVSEYYVDSIPKHLQTVFNMHGITFVCCEQNRRKYYIYEKSLEQACRKTGLLSSSTVAQPDTVQVQVSTLQLQDFYVDGEIWEAARPYLQLMDVKTVTIAHNGTTYYVPAQYVEIVARRLGLFV